MTANLREHVLIGTLFRHHHGWVKRLAIRKYGVPPGDVDDVVQKVFLTAMNTLTRFEPTDSPKPWLRAITRRVCANERRLAHHTQFQSADSGLSCERPFRTSDVQQQWQEQPSQLVQEKFVQVQQWLRRSGRRIPAEQRHAFAMVVLEGHTLKEAAAILDISADTVASRLRAFRSKARHDAGDRCLSRALANERASVSSSRTCASVSESSGD